MDSIQIYYLLPESLNKSLDILGVNLDTSIKKGSLSKLQLYLPIKGDREFCRDQKSINYKHFLSLIQNGIVLYAILDEKVVGALTFSFNVKNEDKIIMFDGICSPIKYSGLGVGQKLINSLIKVAKDNAIKYIYLECKGDIMNYYTKFGFKILNKRVSYDSDDSDDEDGDGEPYYDMVLDMSKVTGGKKRVKINTKRNKKLKRKQRTRKRKNKKILK
jgi:N-acetylglutamate synthase-like GNAT family acetyltransferase